MKLVIVAGIAVLTGCGSHPPPAPKSIGNTAEGVAAPPTAGKVSGTVYDEDGNPLAGATLVLGVANQDSDDNHVCISDDNGRYAIPATVEPGHYTLTIYYAEDGTPPNSPGWRS